MTVDEALACASEGVEVYAEAVREGTLGGGCERTDATARVWASGPERSVTLTWEAIGVLANEVRRVRGRTCWMCRFNEDGVCRHDEVDEALAEAARKGEGISVVRILADQIRRQHHQRCETCRFNTHGFCLNDHVGGECARIRFCGLWAATGEAI